MNNSMYGNSSKELLYSEYTGTSVVRHVLETLEKKSNKDLRKKSEDFFKKKEKSEVFERARKLMNFIEKEQDASNASTENSKESCNVPLSTEKKGIEVVMEINEKSPESDVDAWFLFKLSKEQESKCSDDDDDDESEKNSPAQEVLNSNDSSDTSDDEFEQNFHAFTNGYALNGTDSSNSSSIKKEIYSSHPSKLKNGLNFLIDDSSDVSNDELPQNFPIITNGFMLNGNDSSNFSSGEEKLNSPASSNMQNSSYFANDDCSNSSDVRNGQCLSVSIVKDNRNSRINSTLQISLPLKMDKRIIEIPNESSEDLNEKVINHPSSSHNIKKLPSGKKTMSNFALKDSPNYSLNECKQNGTTNKAQKLIIENESNSSYVMDDAFILRREKLIALEKESSEHSDSKIVECLPKKQVNLKRKLCVVQDEVTSNCSIQNGKKSLLD